MATTGGTKRSSFLRELFKRDPGVTLEGASKAWREAGNEGEVSSSLFYNVKRSAASAGPAPHKPDVKRAKGKGTGRPGTGDLTRTNETPTTPPAAKKPTSGDRERALDRVEDRIDDLILDLKLLGGMEEALEALRKVRRVVVRSHEG